MTSIVTTVAQVKAWTSKITGSSLDAKLQELIDSVGGAFEAYMLRPLLEEARTETIHRVRRFDRMLTVKAAPINTSPAPTVKYDADRGFGAGITAISTDDYYIDTEAGAFHFDSDLTEGRGVYQVVYTGGMGTDTADLLARFPDIVHAANVQVVYEYQRRNTPGSSSESGQGGNVTFEAAVQLLKHVKQLLDPYKRRRAYG